MRYPGNYRNTQEIPTKQYCSQQNTPTSGSEKLLTEFKQSTWKNNAVTNPPTSQSTRLKGRIVKETQYKLKANKYLDARGKTPKTHTYTQNWEHCQVKFNNISIDSKLVFLSQRRPLVSTGSRVIQHCWLHSVCGTQDLKDTLTLHDGNWPLRATFLHVPQTLGPSNHTASVTLENFHM